jgi:hypothetical protein
METLLANQVDEIVTNQWRHKIRSWSEILYPKFLGPKKWRQN